MPVSLVGHMFSGMSIGVSLIETAGGKHGSLESVTGQPKMKVFATPETNTRASASPFQESIHMSPTSTGPGSPTDQATSSAPAGASLIVNLTLERFSQSGNAKSVNLTRASDLARSRPVSVVRNHSSEKRLRECRKVCALCGIACHSLPNRPKEAIGPPSFFRKMQVRTSRAVEVNCRVSTRRGSGHCGPYVWVLRSWRDAHHSSGARLWVPLLRR